MGHLSTPVEVMLTGRPGATGREHPQAPAPDPRR